MGHIPVNDFVNAVLQTFSPTPWPYVSGASGKNGVKKADCVGAVMYALRTAGGYEFKVHGSNYAARWEVEELIPIRSDADLFFGGVIFKACDSTSSKYDLPMYRYGAGKPYANGDLLDYYHIGTVTKDPKKKVEITHCTGPCTKQDFSIGNRTNGWKFIARLKCVDYSSTASNPITPSKETEEPSMSAFAKVWASNGGTVKARAVASTTCPVYDELPVGTQVTVIEKKPDWTKIQYNGKERFIKTEFLKFPESPEAPEVSNSTGEGATRAELNSIKQALTDLLEKVNRMLDD